jgi:hypothetical protein
MLELENIYVDNIDDEFGALLNTCQSIPTWTKEKYLIAEDITKQTKKRKYSVGMGARSHYHPDKELDENFTESYGIFSGKATQRAKLRFTPERARWVSVEEWHPNQISTVNKDGFYTLEFDYNQDPELVMDILRHGSEVEVISPPSLRDKVANELKKAAQKY